MKALFQAGLAREKAKTLLRDGEFAELFAELGWDAPSVAQQEIEIPLREQPAPLRYVAEKRGFVVCVCDIGDEEPARDFRRAVGKEFAKVHYENILIFRGGGRQFWQVSIRPQNRPLRVVTVDWWEKQDPNRLLDKLDGVIFGVAEEGGLNIVDVVTRVRESFVKNAESVTRKFYGQFKKELDAFAEFISGLRAAGNGASRQWYAALMLNRLMFCYFIQKKGFLDGDKNYLRNRLKESRDKFGEDKFHRAFYREFLRRLFHEGLGAPPEARKSDFKQMLGNIPYLNGGLFDPVDAENENPELDIADGAFERVFNFFDQWNWHLDERPTASGKDINPDVIGYIFEKYINDRAKMGAYYTQEDVTGHIARGAILPVILRRARTECKAAFSGDGGIWKLLRDNPEKYIYAAAQHGCKKEDSEIPEDIRIGLDSKAPNLAQRRKNWNRPASAEFGHPTETWREVIARRARFFALRVSLKNDECESVEFLLSHNLDIQRFMDDALREYEGSDFIAAVFRALAGRKPEKSNQHHRRPLSVLDPACGSGAFLFAALNDVLAPLYNQCLNRMKDFVDEDNNRVKHKKGAQKKFPEFRRIIDEVDTHPNEEYWIRKSCILNNLHGVDIMPEAVEIAKLRLFLNLAAKAECDPQKNNMGLEPLPDIDFNIRPGNALVGFVNMANFDDHVTEKLGLDQKAVDKVHESFSWVERADIRFREAQKHDTPQEYRAAKADLVDRLGKLDGNLNGYLARISGKKGKDEIRAWTESHRPFHWLSNFYGIMSGGGFDAVIGNPPYVECRPAQVPYSISGYRTMGNLFALFIERAFALGQDNFGMIVPISLPSTPRMRTARQILGESKKGTLCVANFADRPGCVFVGVHQKLSIFLFHGEGDGFYSTDFVHWNTNTRPNLLAMLAYQKQPMPVGGAIWPKIGEEIELRILEKIAHRKQGIINALASGNFPIYMNMRMMFFVKCFLTPKASNEYKFFRATSKERQGALMAILNSSIFFWFWEVVSDCWHLTQRELIDFAVDMDAFPPESIQHLAELGRRLEADLEAKKEYVNTKQIDYEYKHKKSKCILDEIDFALAGHYGFTDEELDYIVNYDVKFRTDGE